MTSPNHSILVVAHYHEPLAFWRRRGGWLADSERHHEKFFTAETVEKLAALGVTTVVWPGYKGLGLQFERPELERLKPFRKLLDRAGIELGVYLQCGSYYAETFYEENPQARDWTALDYWGKPHVYSEYYRCYWRHRPCLTHRAFSEYVAHAAQTLIKDYGATYFNCDNNAQMPCHTPHFRQAFVQFLKDKYQTHTTEGLATFVRRYGHPNVDNIVLPSGSPRHPLESLHALPDPGLQDWVEFRCRLVAGNAQIITAAAKQANPNVRLCYNLAYDYGEFHQLVWATEPEFVAPHADFIFSEDGNQPRVTADGRLISQVHTAKHVRAMGLRANLYPPHGTADKSAHDAMALWMMEMAVHNQGDFGCLYANDFDLPDGDPRPATLRFVRKHQDVFTDNTTVSQIAVLRSRHSSAINWLEATEGRLLAQQALYEAGLQWDNVLESLDGLDRYRLLILPDTVSVPNACAKRIADYVRGGGRVLAVGAALSCDEWGCRRAKSAAMSLFAERDSAYGLSEAKTYAGAVLAAWLGLEGQPAGRVFAFPRLVHPNPLRWDPDATRAPVLNFEYHAMPLNGEAFLAAVRDALQAPPLVETVCGNPNARVVPALLRSLRDRSVSLHVLNYRPQEKVASLTVRLNLPELRAVSGAQVLLPESDRPLPLAVAREGDATVLTLPAFRHYAGVLFGE